MTLKEKIKLYIFPTLAMLLNKLGFSYERLGKTVLDKSVILAQCKSLVKGEIAKSDKPQSIIILLMLPGSTFHLFIEGLIGLALRKRGHSVLFVIDKNMLPIHELKKINNESSWDDTALRGYEFGKLFLQKLGLDYKTIDQIVKSEKELAYDSKYDNIVESMLLKQYKVGIITDDLPNIKEKKSQIKRAISITHQLGQEIVKMRPDSVIMSHGIYSTWGPPFQVLNDNNIPILVHGRGKMRHSQVFNWNKTGDSWDVSDEWQKVKDKELTEIELSKINDYLDSRVSHKNDVFVYNFGEATSKSKTIDFLGLDPQKPIYTLFTNVLWDAASAQREIAFINPVEWVIETIDWFNRHPEKQLIVKIHPAEVVIGTNMPFYNIILDKIQPSTNVRIIRPEEKVNSWSIYDITTMGMVHTTTAGMEMPLVNVPCIVVSKTHFRGKGFTLDIESKQEYFEMLDSFDPLSVDFKHFKREALKYSYLLFIRYQVPFNAFYEEESTLIKGFSKNQIGDYFEDGNFKNIIDCIEKTKDIFNANA